MVKLFEFTQNYYIYLTNPGSQDYLDLRLLFRRVFAVIHQSMSSKYLDRNVSR